MNYYYLYCVQCVYVYIVSCKHLLYVNKSNLTFSVATLFGFVVVVAKIYTIRTMPCLSTLKLSCNRVHYYYIKISLFGLLNDG